MSQSPRDLVVTILGEIRLEQRMTSGDILQIREITAGADLVLATLATTLTTRTTGVNKLLVTRAPLDLADDLKACGFDILALANNHILDYGIPGLVETQQALDRVGIRYAGAGRDVAAAFAPVVTQVGGRSVAVLSMCCTLPPGWAATDDAPGVAPVRIRNSFIVDDALLSENPGLPPEVHTWPDEDDLEYAVAAVRHAKEQHDIVIAMMHWGLPPRWRLGVYPVTQEYQRTLGHALIDAGADAVTGDHAFELNGIELYGGRPLIYSDGISMVTPSLIWPQMKRFAAGFDLCFPADGGPCSVQITPLLINERGIVQRDPVAGAWDHITTYSREHGSIVDGKGVVVPTPPTRRIRFL